jgi:short-subunit dehydrogenase
MDTTTSEGMPASKCAKKIIRAIERKKSEVYIGGSKEIAAVYLKRFLPSLFSTIVRNVRVR